MLSRYHIVSIVGIVVLGIIGSYLTPDARVPSPWTLILLIMAAVGASASFAFVGAARFSSPTLVSENMRFSRFPEPVRFAHDGKMTWAAVPVKGWIYFKTFVNSVSNPGIALLPACLLEGESWLYLVARVKFYKMSPKAIAILSRRRSFGRLFAELGFGPGQKTDLYLGIQSGTLHPDATHIKTSLDLNAYARSLATDETEYTRVARGLQDRLSEQLNMWQRIQNSEPAQVIIRRENQERQ